VEGIGEAAGSRNQRVSASASSGTDTIALEAIEVSSARLRERELLTRKDQVRGAGADHVLVEAPQSLDEARDLGR